MSSHIIPPANGGSAVVLLSGGLDSMVVAALMREAGYRLFALTIDYTKGRHAFGKPLFALQNTKFVIAEAATTARIARVFIDDCITKHLNNELDVQGAAMAKYWTTEQLGIVADKCLQLFGGYGYMTEYPISQIYTGARILRILAGTNEIMKELIARGV